MRDGQNKAVNRSWNGSEYSRLYSDIPWLSSRIFVLAAYSLLRRASSLSRPLASLPSLCTVRLSVVSSGPPVQLGFPLPLLVVCRHSLVLHQAVDLGAILYPGGRPAASHSLVLHQAVDLGAIL